MISVNHIDRRFQTGQFELLLDGLASNGLDLPLPLRVRLSQTPAGAIALALRRLLELTYGPTSLSQRMIGALLANQLDDGSFGHDPLATAAVIAALSRKLHDQPDRDNAVITDARDRALAALSQMQNDDGLFQHSDDRTTQDRALTAAFVLYLLAGDQAFRAAVRFADLMNWFDDHEDRLDSDAEALMQIARLDTRDLHDLATATLAAIAA